MYDVQKAKNLQEAKNPAIPTHPVVALCFTTLSLSVFVIKEKVEQ
jgi:hypothetical protein